MRYLGEVSEVHLKFYSEQFVSFLHPVILPACCLIERVYTLMYSKRFHQLSSKARRKPSLPLVTLELYPSNSCLSSDPTIQVA
jgi:hypothetical protein